MKEKAICVKCKHFKNFLYAGYMCDAFPGEGINDFVTDRIDKYVQCVKPNLKGECTKFEKKENILLKGCKWISLFFNKRKENNDTEKIS
jgi:hypothetical protein